MGLAACLLLQVVSQLPVFARQRHRHRLAGAAGRHLGLQRAAQQARESSERCNDKAWRIGAAAAVHQQASAGGLRSEGCRRWPRGATLPPIDAAFHLESIGELDGGLGGVALVVQAALSSDGGGLHHFGDLEWRCSDRGAMQWLAPIWLQGRVRAFSTWSLLAPPPSRRCRTPAGAGGDW